MKKDVWLTLVGFVSLIIAFVLILFKEIGAAFFFTALGVIVYLVTKRRMEMEQ